MDMALDLRRMAEVALEAALRDDQAPPAPPPPKHRSGTRTVAKVLGLGAVAGVAWTALRPRLPGLGELGERARDQLADLGLLEDELDDRLDTDEVGDELGDVLDEDEDEGEDEDEDEDYDDEPEDGEEAPDAEEALED
jgi:hypothetical protein